MKLLAWMDQVETKYRNWLLLGIALTYLALLGMIVVLGEAL